MVTIYTVADNDRRSALQRRTWDAKTKAMIVIEGLKGKPAAELCNEHQISQAQYNQWRDQFLAQAGQVFEVHQHDRNAAHLPRENARSTALIGELTLE